MKKRLIILTFLLVCTLTFPINVMASGLSQFDSLDTYEKLPNSLSITIPNIDVSKVRDTRPLIKGMKDLLLKKGYAKKRIDQMTIDDYNTLKKTFKLSPESIDAARIIYPQLKNVDISNWTFGEFEDYARKIDDVSYAPTPTEELKLNQRNITLQDARYLLKEFNSYENILTQPDSVLKKVLEKRNQVNIDYVNNIKSKVRPDQSSLIFGKRKFSIQATPPADYIDNYTYCYMPGYQNDYFHNDSLSWDPWVASFQSSKAAAAYRAIYNLPSETPTYTNMWGTYSGSSNGAHEGIDMIYLSTPPVYSIATGQVRYSSGDIVAVYDNTSTSNTIFYNHLSSRAVSYLGSISKGGKIGNQGYGGTGYHLHIQVEYGMDPIEHSARDDHNLDSANVYTFINSNGY